MPSSIAGLLGAAALAAAGVPLAPGGAMLWLPTCHGGAIPISLPHGRDGPGKSCPGGCHAACATRKGKPGTEPEDA